MLLDKEKFPEILKVYEGEVEVVFSVGFNEIKVGWFRVGKGEIEEAELWKSKTRLRGEKAIREILSGDYLFRVDFGIWKQRCRLEEPEDAYRWKTAVSSLKGGGKPYPDFIRKEETPNRDELLKRLGIREPTEEEVERILENIKEELEK